MWCAYVSLILSFLLLPPTPLTPSSRASHLEPRLLRSSAQVRSTCPSLSPQRELLSVRTRMGEQVRTWSCDSAGGCDVGLLSSTPTPFPVPPSHFSLDDSGKQRRRGWHSEGREARVCMQEQVIIRTRAVMSRSEVGVGRCTLGVSLRDVLLFLLPSPSVLLPSHLL